MEITSVECLFCSSQTLYLHFLIPSSQSLISYIKHRQSERLILASRCAEFIVREHQFKLKPGSL